MKRQNVRTLSLIVVTFTYLLLGAAIFDHFESDNEVEEHQRLTESANKLRHKYNMSQDDFDQITQLAIQMKPYKAGTQWKFAGAFYFATTVITTIGYGHSTPKTDWGKIFCMCYAVPGIPLCLVMFQSIGERMNTSMTWLLRQVKKQLSCKCRSVSQTNLMLVSFTTGTTVLAIGAVVFSCYEEWDYLDSFYYCFITLTTIGFGDFVALQRNNSLARRPDYVAFSLIFILFGLTVVSSVMNLVVLRFLTMNTEDERRDQLEAAAQAQELQRLRGDVIWTEPEYETANSTTAYLPKEQAAKMDEFNFFMYQPTLPNNVHRLFSGLSSLFTPQSRLVRGGHEGFFRQPHEAWRSHNVKRKYGICDQQILHTPLSHQSTYPHDFLDAVRISYNSKQMMRSFSVPENHFPLALSLRSTRSVPSLLEAWPQRNNWHLPSHLSAAENHGTGRNQRHSDMVRMHHPTTREHVYPCNTCGKHTERLHCKRLHSQPNYPSVHFNRLHSANIVSTSSYNVSCNSNRQLASSRSARMENMFHSNPNPPTTRFWTHYPITDLPSISDIYDRRDSDCSADPDDTSEPETNCVLKELGAYSQSSRRKFSSSAVPDTINAGWGIVNYGYDKDEIRRAELSSCRNRVVDNCTSPHCSVPCPKQLTPERKRASV
ncbi:hypothetical protein CRM22_011102 [Opisthorchis felineus]|uniref:Potassium channel domain-containing protein n=2 Tax=Opisthorchis felineus TaxID=147828 RepID=A0A4S2KG57_OPIFE|nr:hypothetical protein CRM22_011102 [Opisthorchis felineus]